MLGLYLHIPFCQAICSYCNFNRGLFDAGVAKRYVAALTREIHEAATDQEANTIFFGGGTPSILDPADIAQLIAACRSTHALAPDAEVTLETNPETVTPDKMDGWRRAGVNRISFGAQSFDGAELKRLDRVHTPERIGRAVADARSAGFDNVSLDLMFWLPGQTRESWRRSVAAAAALEPEHLSVYLLELYPNAPLREAMARATSGGGSQTDWQQSADDDAADMYLEAMASLEGLGYEQYEISNVARPGRESRHNLKYWTGESWRGFGCGAHSTVGDERWSNVTSTGDYMARIDAGQPVSDARQKLSSSAQLEEALFTGIRLTAGVNCAVIRQRFDVDPWKRFEGDLQGALDAGLVWRSTDGFGLTRSGMLLSNEIGQIFI